MLNMFANITYTWNGNNYEVTLTIPCGSNVEEAFKAMHTDAVINNIDYEM